MPAEGASQIRVRIDEDQAVPVLQAPGEGLAAVEGAVVPPDAGGHLQGGVGGQGAPQEGGLGAGTTRGEEDAKALAAQVQGQEPAVVLPGQLTVEAADGDREQVGTGGQGRQLEVGGQHLAVGAEDDPGADELLLLGGDAHLRRLPLVSPTAQGETQADGAAGEGGLGGLGGKELHVRRRVAGAGAESV